MPGGSPFVGAGVLGGLGRILGGPAAAGAAAGYGLGQLMGGSCPTLFRESSGARAYPIRRINQINPVSGNVETWEHAGHPLVYSRDRVAAKRWSKYGGCKRGRRFR